MKNRKAMALQATLFSAIALMAITSTLGLPNVVFVATCGMMLVTAAWGYSRGAYTHRGHRRYLSFGFAVSFWCLIPFVIQNISLFAIDGNGLSLSAILFVATLSSMIVYCTWLGVLSGSLTGSHSR